MKTKNSTNGLVAEKETNVGLPWFIAGAACSALILVLVFWYLSSTESVPKHTSYSVAELDEEAAVFDEKTEEKSDEEQSVTSNESRFEKAVVAVFGNQAKRTIKIGNNRYDERPFKLIRTSFGPVLLTINTNKTDCHACAGAIGAYYFKEIDGEFGITSRFPEAFQGWGWGQPPQDFEIVDNFTRYPALYAEGGFMGQGYLESTAALVELTPSGPQSSIIGIGSDDSGAVGEENATSIEGKIVDIKKDQGFSVQFSGSCFDKQRFRKIDKVFKAVGKTACSGRVYNGE